MSGLSRRRKFPQWTHKYLPIYHLALILENTALIQIYIHKYYIFSDRYVRDSLQVYGSTTEDFLGVLNKGLGYAQQCDLVQLVYPELRTPATD